MSVRDEPVTIDADLRGETDKAYLIYDGDEEIWVPKSLVEFEPSRRNPEFGEFTMPMWLAEKHGLA